MIVTIKAIRDKINDLPADFAEHVHPKGPATRATGGTAEVESFSDPTQEVPYTVHIKAAEVESNLNVTCSCASVTLCLHVVAYYAFNKDLKPAGQMSLEDVKGDGPEGKEGAFKPVEQVIAEGILEIALTLNRIADALEKK